MKTQREKQPCHWVISHSPRNAGEQQEAEESGSLPWGVQRMWPCQLLHFGFPNLDTHITVVYFFKNFLKTLFT